MVCRGDVDLTTAQHDISTDWIAAYRKYFHADRPVSDDSPPIYPAGPPSKYIVFTNYRHGSDKRSTAMRDYEGGKSSHPPSPGGNGEQAFPPQGVGTPVLFSGFGFSAFTSPAASKGTFWLLGLPPHQKICSNKCGKNH